MQNITDLIIVIKGEVKTQSQRGRGELGLKKINFNNFDFTIIVMKLIYIKNFANININIKSNLRMWKKFFSIKLTKLNI